MKIQELKQTFDEPSLILFGLRHLALVILV